MKKVAIFIAQGFEEGETLLVADIIRRAGFICHLVSVQDTLVRGGHDVVVQADRLLSEMDDDYDMVLMPGGGGAHICCKIPELLDLFRKYNKNPDKFVAAICAGVVFLAEADITKNRKVTSNPNSFKRTPEKFADCDYSTDIVVLDGHLLTSQGPGMSFEFGFAVVELLGGPADELRESMLYNKARGIS